MEKPDSKNFCPRETDFWPTLNFPPINLWNMPRIDDDDLHIDYYIPIDYNMPR